MLHRFLRSLVEFLKRKIFFQLPPTYENDKNIFVAYAVTSGIDEKVASNAYYILLPWQRKTPLSLSTRLKKDLGIVDEDLVDTVCGMWEAVVGRPITQNEASQFINLETVGDLLS